MDKPHNVALVGTDPDTATTWRCLDFCPEGPFDDGEVLWHFEMEHMETGKQFLVSISGPLKDDGEAAAAALMAVAGIIGASAGIPVQGVTITGKPN